MDEIMGNRKHSWGCGAASSSFLALAYLWSIHQETFLQWFVYSSLFCTSPLMEVAGGSSQKVLTPERTSVFSTFSLVGHLLSQSLCDAAPSCKGLSIPPLVDRRLEAASHFKGRGDCISFKYLLSWQVPTPVSLPVKGHIIGPVWNWAVRRKIKVNKRMCVLGG